MPKKEIMDGQESAVKRGRLSVRNIGGIDETEVEFSPGVTVLEGHNATNRTSLLQSIMAIGGSDRVSIKGDADSAEVSLNLGGEEYQRTLTREDGQVVGQGNSPVEDPELATLFAFLLESNEARQAVARGDDLREIIMRPIDTATLKQEIREDERRKREIDNRLNELDDLAEELPELRQRRTSVIEKIEATETELSNIEAQIDAAAGSIEADKENQSAVEKKLSELRELRSELDDIRYDVETERESLDKLREEREELIEERETLPEASDDVETLDRELSEIRERRDQLESKLGELDSVIQFNSEMLTDSKSGIQQALETDKGNPTDKLLQDSKVTCWTCGSAVDQESIESTLSLLADLREQTAAERDEVVEEIDQLEERRNNIEQRKERRTEIERRLDRIEDEIDSVKTAIDNLEDRREELESEIESTETEVERLREATQSEVIDLHEEADQLERKLGRLSEERDSLDEEISSIESSLEEREELTAERETLSDRLVERRTRIEQVQNEAIETFNDRMDTVLDLLEYDNIGRVWIERIENGNSKATFDLHIVRDSTSGAAYEDSVEHLSESEREVIGLVFALAGYLVHDVHEVCPFILLDSLEAIDADRIARLVDYFADYGRFLVVALLPGDAAALDDSYERVTDI